MSFAHKTRAEQRLEWLESLRRPLTPAESDELRRSLHAVYCRNRRFKAEDEMNGDALARHRKQELQTLGIISVEYAG